MAFTGQRIYPKIHCGVETTDATITTAISYTVSTNGVGEFDFTMIGRDNVSGELLHGRKVVKIKRVSGTLSVVSTIIDLITTTIDGINMATASWTIDISGDDIRVRVTGVVGRTIHWQGKGDLILN